MSETITYTTKAQIIGDVETHLVGEGDDAVLTIKQAYLGFKTVISEGKDGGPKVTAWFKIDLAGATIATLLLLSCASSSIPVRVRATAKKAFESFDDMKGYIEKHATKDSPMVIGYKDVGSQATFDDPDAQAIAALKAMKTVGVTKAEARKQFGKYNTFAHLIDRVW